MKTIRSIWASKAQLGLLKGPVPDTDAFGKTELMLAVTGWEDGDPAVIRGYLPHILERKIGAVASKGRELYFDRTKLLSGKECPMAGLKIYHGASQIGGCCTKIISTAATMGCTKSPGGHPHVHRSPG